jgi:hypothetical protein
LREIINSFSTVHHGIHGKVETKMPFPRGPKSIAIGLNNQSGLHGKVSGSKTKVDRLMVYRTEALAQRSTRFSPQECWRIAMSADWYYIKYRWVLGSKKVGPISDAELLTKIDSGEITPQTLLMSSKTHEHWVKMSEISTAYKRWLKSHPELRSA